MARMGGASGPIEFEVLGEREFKVGLGRMTKALGDMRPFWEKGLKPAFFQVEKAQFASQGAAGRNGAWQGLSPKYAAWKARKFPGRGILVRSGALSGALLGGSGFVFQSHPQWVAIGASSGYGTYHQKGGGSLPRRRPIDVSAEQEKHVFGAIFGLVARDMNMMWSAGRDMRQ